MIQLREFEAATDETNLQLRAVLIELFQAEEKAERQDEELLSRALASLERLNEIARAISKHLDAPG